MILTVGVPGSGKSTVAKQIKAADPENVVIVERDQTRSNLFGEKYHKGNFPKREENQVTAVNNALIKKGLREGKTVIVSDTNLNFRTVGALAKTARDYGADLSFEHLDVDPQECKRRNRARGAAGGREVPDHVMDRMISQSYGDDGHLKEMKVGANGAVFFVPQSTPGSRLIDSYNKKAEFDHPMVDEAVVFVDVDGTLANNGADASYYLNNPNNSRKNFEGFFRSIAKAPVNENVRDLANRMRQEEGVGIVVLTGRSDSHAKELLEFIKKSGIKASRVIAKKDGDYRPDSDFKHEVITSLKSEGLVPVHALDDRESSIRIMEDHGILVSRVDIPEVTLPTDGSRPAYGEAPAVNTIYGQGVCIRCGKPLKSGNIGPKCRLK